MAPAVVPLRRGDRVRLVAASSALAPDSLLRLEAGMAVLRTWGLQPEPHAALQRRWGYLAGLDRQRAADLEGTASLWACVRGGWGAARLLENPALALPSGWLLGFSDVTALLWSQRARGLSGGIHGPLLTTLAAEPAWSQERLRQLLFGEPLAPLQGQCWQPGVAEGPLLAANLTVATHLLGSPHCPPLEGAILVLEDVGEAPYRLDRMLTHWRLCGALQQLAGLALGRFDDSDQTEGDHTEGDHTEADETEADGFSTAQVLHERTADLGIPVIAGLPVGHGNAGNAALPLGHRARLDASAGCLSVESPSVERFSDGSAG
jgi:muramoyltetrapeptide carboxypeptidase